MHVRKACERLHKLASAPKNMATFAAAYVLLDGLNVENAECEAGKRENGTAREKISSARGWFEILCGIGEDGKWPEQGIRSFIQADIAAISDQSDDAGYHFQHWPEAEPEPAGPEDATVQ